MKEVQFIGRVEEAKILREALTTPRAEMISVIGRRRVGKTFLIETVYQDFIDFQLVGSQNAPKKEQLINFTFSLEAATNSKFSLATPTNWTKAFQELVIYLRKRQEEIDRKLVVFFDELPWLATHRSGFLRALGFFWNSWAVKQNIVVVICGSAASWMIDKVVKNKGGLHNRITRRIKLYPFNLSETEAFLRSQGSKMERYHIAQLYMIMGGIPHYLLDVNHDESVDQNVARICFSEMGMLLDEFENLYSALFDKPEIHEQIIRVLGNKWSGMTRQEIIAQSKLKDGGRVTRVLQELEQSGFIKGYFPFGKKRTGLIYRLTDEYSLFYLRFIEDRKIRGIETWLKASQSQPYKIWRGYAFENLALKHTLQLKRGLQIAGIYSEDSSFYRPAKDGLPGVQIDLLIDRADHCINVCEIKFYNEEFVVSKEYKEKLRQKLKVFRRATKTKKQLFLTLVTTFGLEVNHHSVGTIDKVLDINAFFRTE